MSFSNMTTNLVLVKLLRSFLPMSIQIQHLIAISKLDFLPQIHPQLHVPCMKFMVPDVKIVVPSMVITILLFLFLLIVLVLKDVLCTVNVQHDCSASACNAVKQVAERQERLVTTRTKDLVGHSSTNAFLLNTHALHNYQHLAAVIPPSLHSQLNVSLITNHETIRLNAAKVVRAKKVTTEDGTGPNTTLEEPVQAPAFDRVKRGPKGKGKGKATVSRNTQVTQGNQQEMPTSTVPPSVLPNPISVPLPNLHSAVHYQQPHAISGQQFPSMHPPDQIQTYSTWPLFHSVGSYSYSSDGTFMYNHPGNSSSS